MNSFRKILLLFAIFSILLTAEIYRVLNFSRGYSVYSPSGKYLLEEVRVFTPLAPSFNMGFFRIYDEVGGREYRSPLFRYDEFEMRVYESQQLVGVYDLLLSKPDGTFQVALNHWCPHWLNYLVSNAPYRVIGDGRCEERLSDW